MQCMVNARQGLGLLSAVRRGLLLAPVVAVALTAHLADADVIGGSWQNLAIRTLSKSLLIQN